MIMTPDQIEEAAELLCERDALTQKLKRLSAAKLIRIEYCTDPSDERSDFFSSAGEFRPTPVLRKLLLDPVQSALSTVDARLTELGVELSSLQKERA